MKGLEADVIVKFDNISALREADHFINPLRARERQVRMSSNSFSADHCLDAE